MELILREVGPNLFDSLLDFICRCDIVLNKKELAKGIDGKNVLKSTFADFVILVPKAHKCAKTTVFT